MACLATREHFSAYAEGALPPAKRELLAAHLADCPICGPAFARFARGLDALAIERRAPAPPGMGDRMLAALGLPPRPRGGPLRRAWRALPRPARTAAAAVLLAGGLLAGVALGPGMAREWAADTLAVERGPGGAWLPRDPAAREALVRALGAANAGALANEPAVRERVLREAGLEPGPARWWTPAEREAAEARAAGLVRLGDEWLARAAFEETVRARAGLVYHDGAWRSPEALADHLSRSAGLVWYDGAWRPATEVEVALLRARGFTREGDRWVSAEERALADAVASERARAATLSAELAAARTGASAPPPPAPSVTTGDVEPALISAPAGADPAVAGLLHGLEVLAPTRLGDAIVIPLARPGAPTMPSRDPAAALVPATAAMAAGKVTIENRQAVRLHNGGPHPVLLIAGEILTGGKQDRLVQRDAVVEPGGRVELAVLCCEKDRSTARGSEYGFRALGAHASTTLRRLIVSGAAQEAVWDGITAHHRAANLHSPTQALQVTYTHPSARDRALQGRAALEAHLQARHDVVGLAVVRQGQIDTLDVYPDPAFFRSQLGPLVAGVLLHEPAFAPDEAALAVAAQRVAGALAAAAGERPAAGGTLEVAACGLAGYVTAWREQGVHLCLVTPLATAPAVPPVAPTGGASRPTTTGGSVAPAPGDTERPSSPGELERRAARGGRLTPEEQRELDRIRARRNRG